MWFFVLLCLPFSLPLCLELCVCPPLPPFWCFCFFLLPLAFVFSSPRFFSSLHLAPAPPPPAAVFSFSFFSLVLLPATVGFFFLFFLGGGGGCPAPDFCRACSPCGAVCHAVPPLVAFVPLLWCASWWWWCCQLLPPPGPSQFKFQPPHSECVGPGLVPLGDQEKGGQTFCCPYPPEQK